MSNLPLIVFLICFVLMFVLRMPIPTGMIAACTMYFLVDGLVKGNSFIGMITGSEGQLHLVAQKSIEAIFTNQTIIAVPLFIFAANVMNAGKITEYVFGVCKGLVGRFPGGLAHVNVLASLVFSGMTGSAVADASGLGKMEIDAMRAEGYDDGFSCAITAASATIGPIFPPSIPMVIYGAAASVSVGTLFMAGIGPGIIIALVLGFFVFAEAKKRKYKVHPRSSLREIFRWFCKSFWALLMIAIILGGISCGAFTPTEASCIAIAYCLFAVCVIYREMPFSNIGACISETVTGIVPALSIVSAASLFGWVLQFEHLGKLMLNGILSFTSNKLVVLLLIDLILLFLGMILDSTPTILLMVPIFQPLVQQLGISEIHLGIVVILNLMIGLMTPPYGQSLFMLASATKTPFNKVVKYVSPWLIPMFIALALVTFFPDITLLIPRLLGMDV